MNSYLILFLLLSIDFLSYDFINGFYFSLVMVAQVPVEVAETEVPAEAKGVVGTVGPT